MQVSGLIHGDACVGHDGIDRTISFAAIAPALPLMKLLIDGPVSSSLLRSGFSDEFHLPSFTYQSTKLETGIMQELSFHCYSECRVSMSPGICRLHEEC